MSGIISKLKNSLWEDNIKKMVLKVGKVLFLIIVALVIIQHIPQLIGNLKIISPWTIASVLILQLITLVLVAYQWRLCSGVFEHREIGRIRDFWIINSYGTLLEGVTPAAKTGGEGLKAVMISRNLHYSKEEAILLVLCHKIISMGSFFVVMAAFYYGLFMAIPRFLLDKPVIVTLLSILALVLIILCLLPKIKQRISTDSWLNMVLEKSGFFIRLFWKHKLLVTSAFVIGLIIWFLLGVKSYLISLGMGVELSFLQVTNATFIGYLFGMIPVSPGGLGTYEGAMTVQLYRMGLSRGLGFSLSLLSRLTTFWFTLLVSFISVTIANLISSTIKK
ncbi:lysylphosphatidylglycerol synthase transmembrane domain-containing protein [Natranaerobius thermophilus]|uniref:Phosphatidylglycerol lysyltransferase n=1 Tax=Natranaerobius thermophilus (strain ATCC BAA-1301 / DSM 18059 / JW/NM-WN-LF) TaxID=457570 RepID=B2A8E7_NATTJ|nr:lysylphosphatidylglycerol synthase transmembrane domain-containing protein [Natranaerobius thermophilus]ACB85831.1 conserved hypothetical protein [Natranaerobius thermophilus JW/NM-WN-LF]